ncbi:MAG: hypothetical protein LUH05_05790 [Candidatus Gastranaerophilales bacterium]|nr:hypothetical protein [Candidatus Gastranaerophilales bacterium]
MQSIFSVRNDECHKVLTLFGIKFKFRSLRKEFVKYQEEVRTEIKNEIRLSEKNKAEADKKLMFLKNEISQLNSELQNCCSHILDNFIKEKINKNKETYNQFIDKFFHKEKVSLSVYKKSALNYYSYLFNKPSSFIKENPDVIVDRYVLWGTQFRLRDNKAILRNMIYTSKEYAIAELGFLNRIAEPCKEEKYEHSCSFVFDDIAPYYDSRYPSRMEMLLNDENLVITEEQKQRARNCIDKIISNHLTKYNHQPVYTPNIGREGKKKVLVIDQSYGDMSILKGQAGEETFKTMLECAVKEFPPPEADIIVKTHPDINNGGKGYYTGLKQHDNIYPFTEGINPISLIQYCDEVYVCSSQMGFEALMCGKKVHCFGVSFYSNYGLTDDRQECSRRKVKRTLEEMFYIIYIMYSYYVNPEKGKPCEIEEAIDYLLKLRDEYFNEYCKKENILC